MTNYNYKEQGLTQHKCLVTRQNIDESDLIRFVIDPENNLVADIDQVLPGTGYWVQANREAVSKAIENKVFNETINKKIRIDSNLIQSIENRIRNNIIQQISLSRKAGKAIFGFEKIKSVSPTHLIQLIIQATDGSIKEKTRLQNKCRPQIIDTCLNGSELGKPFGRDRVVHCAILKSTFVQKIIFNANRLKNLKNPVPHYNDGKKATEIASL